MKKLIILLITISLIAPLLCQEEEQKLDMKKEYTFKTAYLLISEIDLNCSYFISQKLSIDMVIIGSETMDTNKIGYTDTEKLFINKGSNDGLTEGDILLIIEKGKAVFNPFTHSKLGIYYQKKSQAVLTCIYEDKSVITLRKGCNPVKIGDLVIPFKAEKTIMKPSINYKNCRIPKLSPTGNVVLSNLSSGVNRIYAGTHDYVTVDMGKAEVSKGNFLLFYKILNKNLPPVIIGTGIVINAQNTNATVKILNAVNPVEIGMKATLLPDIDQKTGKIVSDTGKEDIPIVNTLKNETGELQEGEKMMEVNILFTLNSKTIDEKYNANFAEIKQFIASKSEYIVVLKGYCCSIGNEEYNLKLAQERVEKIKELLINELGINANLIETAYYGEKNAPFDNSQEEQRRKNRLVNIIVRGK